MRRHIGRLRLSFHAHFAGNEKFGGTTVLEDVEHPLTHRSSARLTALIATHKACLAARRMRSGCSRNHEIAVRSAIMAYDPRDSGEALLKLTYLFALVATADAWLPEDNIRDLLDLLNR